MYIVFATTFVKKDFVGIEKYLLLLGNKDSLEGNKYRWNLILEDGGILIKMFEI